MVADLSLGCLTLLLLMFPGWWAARAHRLPLPAVAGFIFGALALVTLLQIFEACRLTLSLQNLTVAWSLVVVAMVLLNPRPPAIAPAAVRSLRPVEFLLLAPLIPAIAVVVYRAITQPLSGVDTIFRWNFLAEQMLVRGSLGFYPPVTGGDYSIYAWPDGIAPIVSSLYFWPYRFAGEARTILTAPVVIAQFILLLFAVHRVGLRVGSPRSAAFAVVLIACSPLLLWSLAMGEESGLLTLALISLLLYLPSSPGESSVPAAIMAGLAAALGGLAREYGLAFILLGLGLGIARRLSKATLGVFVLTAAAGVAPWYLRNWVRTGNPLFNLNPAGLFPVNSAHEHLMLIYQAGFGWATVSGEAFRILLTNCAAAVAGLIAGVFFFKRIASLWAALALMVGLWAVSVSYTSAGFTYSLRVLAPGIAVTALMAGVACARWFPTDVHLRGVTLALFIFSLDSSVRALALPVNAYRIPPADWLTVGGAVNEQHQRPVYHQLANFCAGHSILTLGPAALLNRFSAHTIPPWSPEVACLWDESQDTATIAQRLRAQGIDYFLLSKGEANAAYLSQIAFFRNQHGQALQPIWTDEEMTLFKINVPRGDDQQ